MTDSGSDNEKTTTTVTKGLTMLFSVEQSKPHAAAEARALFEKLHPEVVAFLGEGHTHPKEFGFKGNLTPEEFAALAKEHHASDQQRRHKEHALNQQRRREEHEKTIARMNRRGVLWSSLIGVIGGAVGGLVVALIGKVVG